MRRAQQTKTENPDPHTSPLNSSRQQLLNVLPKSLNFVSIHALERNGVLTP